MRYLLSELASAKVYSSIGTFTTGATVTAAMYNNGVSEPLTSGACVEIGTTGIFYLSLSDITTTPTAYAELLWVMDDGAGTTESGLVIAGGYPESVEPLGDTNQCKITVNLYNPDGSCAVDIEDLFSNTTENYIEVKTSYYQTDRYFQLGKIKPSYDILTKQAFWVLPQGSTFDLKLSSFGLTGSAKTVPSTSTATLYSILNA